MAKNPTPERLETQWTAIRQITMGEIGGHHRANQLAELLARWGDVPMTQNLRGTTTLLLENKVGRVAYSSNHRGLCPRFRLIDFIAKISLECHVRTEPTSKRKYIHSIFLIELDEEKRTTTTLIFDFDFGSDAITTFNASRMSELNEILEK